MKKAFFACATTAFVSAALPGCAPLQQAPLVYSSKVVVGVELAMNVAENQGGAINIGVKSIDSAYVPVAVSKPIDKKSADGTPTVGIQVIEAKYGTGSSEDDQSDAAATERTRKIDAYFKSKQAMDAATKAQNMAEQDVSLRSTRISSVETLKSGIVSAKQLTDTPPDNQRTKELGKRAEEIVKFNAEAHTNFSELKFNKETDEDNLDAVINELDTWLDENRTQKKAAEDYLPILKLQTQTTAEAAAKAKTEAIRVSGLFQTTKTDAMSVYGRFDSTGTGNTRDGGASLLVGKVFSTGLASQNLTEAVKIEARSRCLSNGVEIARLGKDDAERISIWAKMEKACHPEKDKES